jgi:hypothetical protein
LSWRDLRRRRRGRQLRPALLSLACPPRACGIYPAVCSVALSVGDLNSLHAVADHFLGFLYGLGGGGPRYGHVAETLNRNHVTRVRGLLPLPEVIMYCRFKYATAKNNQPIGIKPGHQQGPYRRSSWASWAIFNQCSTILSQRSLSSGLSALSACWRHSSAF